MPITNVPATHTGFIDNIPMRMIQKRQLLTHCANFNRLAGISGTLKNTKAPVIDVQWNAMIR